MNDSVTSDQEQALFSAAQKKDFLEEFGFFHERRAKALGNKLRKWHMHATGLFIILLITYSLHGWLFRFFVLDILKEIKELAMIKSGTEISPPLSATQVVTLYYISKIGLVIILSIPLTWVLHHISKLQSLRAVHSDKAALAYTLERMLNSGISFNRKGLCDSAFREMCSSTLEQVKKPSKEKKSSIDIEDFFPIIKKLIKDGEEAKE